jgi:hypothetical protein
MLFLTIVGEKNQAGRVGGDDEHNGTAKTTPYFRMSVA